MDSRVISEPNSSSITSWHLLSAQEVLDKLETKSESGLSEEEVRSRMAEFGKNELATKKPRPVWKKYLDQFKSFLVIVLLIAAGLAWAIGEFKDAVVILIVTFFNSTLGFYQEHRAEQTLAALKGMIKNKTKVKREGQTLEVDASTLVPGDIVLLDAGDQVPADGRILQAHNLEVAEAALTGESRPVIKSKAKLGEKDIPLAERCNLIFMNTVLTRGRAEMVVTGTGQTTEMGKIAELIAESEEMKTPLQRQLDQLGKRLAAIAVFLVFIILALDYFQGVPLIKAMMTAVALAVAAVPEGLPAVVTVTLAIGMWRMAQNKAILKKLSAVETLGSTTVICSDKTGTLTMNKMKALKAHLGVNDFNVSEEGNLIGDQEIDKSSFLAPLILCSEVDFTKGEFVGDPTEAALFELAINNGINPDQVRKKCPRVAEIPFSSEQKFMATFHDSGDDIEMFIKGAPDVLLERSNEGIKDSIKEKNEELARSGLRVLGIASRSIPRSDFNSTDDLCAWTQDWTYLGSIGLMDPPRPEAREAISSCFDAGIQVKMITGDHKLTASTIAKELGLVGDVILGAEIEAMTLEELSHKTDEISVFARVSPEHKVKIVKALRLRGHITAMTGDGVNDAPALKTADIGVAMGITGSAVTKEAATLVLTDDNFATIVRAVKEGRVIYDNIVKFVRFQLSTNIGAIMTVLASTLAGLPSPFTPIQLLWINIIMDGPPAMSLGLEKAKDGLMSAPPRPRGAQILSFKRLLRLILFGLIMMTGTLFMYHQGLMKGDQSYATTLAFTTFVLFQFFNVFNAREEFRTTFNRNFFRNYRMWVAIIGVLILQLFVIYWGPAQEIFRTKAIDISDWPLLIGVSISVLILEELRKLTLKIFRT